MKVTLKHVDVDMLKSEARWLVDATGAKRQQMQRWKTVSLV